MARPGAAWLLLSISSSLAGNTATKPGIFGAENVMTSSAPKIDATFSRQFRNPQLTV